MIELKHIQKSYTQGSEEISILRDLSLTVQTGEKVAIIGPSGSGKSTLLAIMSGLDRPTNGQVLIDGIDIESLSEKELALFRNKKVSLIFQSFELVQFFTAYENIMLPLSIRDEENPAKVEELLKNMGLDHRKNNLPSALSGGEQQRVAIARALAAGSDIIFADEPTGNLDSTTGKKKLNLLLDTVKETGKTLIIITHDHAIAHQMDTVYELVNGALVRVNK